MSGSQSPQTSRAGEAQRTRWSRVGLPAALVIALCLVSFAAGSMRIGAIKTGRHAENTAVKEALLMAEGQHRYGIVEYTHYPNGPIYALAAMTQLGLSRRQARLLPIAVSALCAAMLLWVLVAPSGPLLRTWATLALGTLVLQPGIVDWQGALHEHSYAISTALLAMALSCCLPARHVWVFSGLGFAAGWIGYDFLPAQGLAVFTLRWTYHCALRNLSLGAAFGRATLDALAFASGAAVAILTHLLQLALYFGSLSQAIRDLLGSAAARMGAEAAASMNPEYVAGTVLPGAPADGGDHLPRLPDSALDLRDIAVGRRRRRCRAGRLPPPVRGAPRTVARGDTPAPAAGPGGGPLRDRRRPHRLDPADAAARLLPPSHAAPPLLRRCGTSRRATRGPELAATG